MRREFGGCAGNIAYNLKLLGGEPIVMATVGLDSAPYMERFAALDISTRCVRQIEPRSPRSASSPPMPTATRSPPSTPAR
jgi:sugar/nucleoside kinase (ribokinase family)